MRIIIFNGQGGSGKGLTHYFMSSYAGEKYGLCTTKTSIIDPVKELASFIGWTGAKEQEDRKFLSDLKDLTDKYNDFSMINLIEKIEKQKHNYDYFFVDMRDPDDIARLINLYPDTITILVKRGDKKDFDNHADSNVFNYFYDYVVENNGTKEELKTTAEYLFDCIHLGDNNEVEK